MALPCCGIPTPMRPWQHVLDALGGYLLLAQALTERPAEFSTSWNFGPPDATSWTVAEIADEVLHRLGSGSWRTADTEQGHEAPVLRLSSSRAREMLDWRSRLSMAASIGWAVDGYRALLDRGGHAWLEEQIGRYVESGADAQPSRAASPVGEAHHA